MSLPPVPTELHRLHTMRAEAESAERAPVRLELEAPGFIVNRAFDPACVRYDARYENALHHSPRFVEYAEDLAARLVARYAFDGGRVAEIGAGDGWFLDLLRRSGAAHAEGVDLRDETDISALDDTEERALVIARHVLEHLPDPVGFLRRVRALFAGSGRAVGAIYLETPSAERMLASAGGVGVLDAIYEHRSHFTPRALAAVAVEAGFRVTGAGNAFDDQFAWVEAVIAEGPSAYPPEDRSEQAFVEFAGAAQRFIRGLGPALEALAASGPVALWGAGSKGKMLLNLAPRPKRVELVTDLNPAKWGSYVAGTGHEIVSPEALRAAPPATVLVPNPSYIPEVRARLEALGLAPRVMSPAGHGWPPASHA